jgi:sporulation protein YlmC with PRC-barrel domain
MEPIKDNLAHIQGMPVVAFEEGLRLGRVHDVFIDRQAKRIRGVSFRSGMWRRESPSYVALADILKIGRDVVIVSGREAASALDDDMAPDSLRHLRGFKITTRDGAWLGEVADLNVDRESGTVSEVLLKDGTILAVDADDIVLGPDVVVVPADYVERITRPETEPNGLLDRIMGPAALTDSLRGKYEEIRASVSSSKSTEKMVDTLRSGSEKTRETVKRTSRKIQETLEQLRRNRGADTAENRGEEDRGYQGAEAEHAGRTHSAGGSRMAAPVHDRGPYAEGDSGHPPQTEDASKGGV